MRFDRGDSLLPAAEPAGRAEVKLPPTYTVSPETCWVQATPFIWAVGNASEVARPLVRCATGDAVAAGGAASVTAAARPDVSATTPTSAMRRRSANRPPSRTLRHRERARDNPPAWSMVIPR